MFRSVYKAIAFFIFYLLMASYLFYNRWVFMPSSLFGRAIFMFTEAKTMVDNANHDCRNLKLEEQLYLEHLLQTLWQSQRIWNCLTKEAKLYEFRRLLEHTKRLKGK